MRKERLENSIPEKAAAAISAAHLLHPAKHFGHPREVLAAVEIGKDEKRALLASWASDMFAIESTPGLRLYHGADKAVTYDEIIDALKSLDENDQQVGEEGLARSTLRRSPRSRRFSGLGLCRYRKGDRRRQLLGF
ncbi:hypothetical protein [Rhizobium sp. Rhizsp42]|uniref:hypothetical protein n=1 Tax=Rhizobium sp. Rhizsp42 TaxID=3243034 RepID=UPI000DBAAA49